MTQPRKQKARVIHPPMEINKISHALGILKNSLSEFNIFGWEIRVRSDGAFQMQNLQGYKSPTRAVKREIKII